MEQKPIRTTKLQLFGAFLRPWIRSRTSDCFLLFLHRLKHLCLLFKTKLNFDGMQSSFIISSVFFKI